MDWLSAERPLLIAHRGASAAAPENTLAAFALAQAEGADGIELDVHLSADGWPVVIHDAHLERTTTGQGLVTQYSLADLRAWTAGEGEPIPTLDEVFAAFGPSLLYNVEIKDWGWRDRGWETAVADLITSYHLEDRVLISTFNPFSLRRARRCLPQRTPVALLRDQGWRQYTYVLGNGRADHPHHSLVNASYMAWARQHNYRVHAWTVDDPHEAERLIRLGVHGIITNKPKFLRHALHLEEMA